MGEVISGTKNLISDSFIRTAFEYFEGKKKNESNTGIIDFIFHKKIEPVLANLPWTIRLDLLIKPVQ